ncbi:g8539 [Coccomyxa elongata]
MPPDSQPIKPPQQQQKKSAGVSAREAAARKLLEQLELETADSLNELERLVEEEHRQEAPAEGGSVRGAALCQIAAALEEAILT